MATTVYGQLSSKQVKKDTIVIDKKIYGLGFPIQSTKRGIFIKQTGIELVKNNLIQLIKTERGERVMLPNYGISLRKFLFEPLDEELFNSLKNEVINSINAYMPEVEIIKISAVITDKINVEGLSGMILTLVAALKEPEAPLIELSVEVG